MIAFITLIYCGLIWLLFFKLKVLPFNAAAKVIVSVVGVAGILALLIFMTMYQPYSKDLTVYQNIVQVAPEVGGRVIEVPVKALAPVKRGDILFKIDPRPYQYQIDKLTASLAEARSDLELTTLELERAEDILKKGAGSSRDVNHFGLRRSFVNAHTACSPSSEGMSAFRLRWGRERWRCRTSSTSRMRFPVSQIAT